MKRIFISINLDSERRAFFSSLIEDLEDRFPKGVVKWTRPENLHMTLLFLGNVKEEGLLFNTVEKAVKDTPCFNIDFSSVSYYPQKSPRYIFALGKKNSLILDLKNNILRSLRKEGFRLNDDGDFLTHLTLGRIKQWEMRRMERDEIPDIEEDISVSLPVNSVSVMESVLKKMSPEYKELISFSLKT